MEFQTRIILGLAAFDAVIIAVFYRWLRSTPPMEGKTLFATGAALFGFVPHALLFFEGMFLILQIATITVLFALCHLQRIGKISTAAVVASK